MLMKKLVCLIPFLLLAGCSKSNVGTAPQRESGTNSEIIVNRPRITSPPTNKPVSLNAPNSALLATALAQSVPNQETNAPAPKDTNTAQGNPPTNEQGAQATPEPKTGDDANPDSQKPTP